MLALSSSLEAGKRLRAVRERLGLTTRDVERLSEQIALEKNDQAFSLSHNWVSDVENGKFRPRLPKLYALCLIYKYNVTEMLSLFGLNVLDLARERAIIALPQTHLVPSIVKTIAPFASSSIQLGKSALEETNLLHRMTENLGEMALFLVQHAAHHNLLYGYVGTEDFTLDPVIRAGSLVQIDPRQTKIVKGVWPSEHARPVYFFELRDNRYACCWCEQEGNRLLLVPSPLSPVQIRLLRYPQDVEVVGRVTGVAMQIAALQPDTLNDASGDRLTA
jgi:transcriptional regulator with XRE-family HTH domain